MGEPVHTRGSSRRRIGEGYPQALRAMPGVRSKRGPLSLADRPVANVVSPSMACALNRNDVTTPKLPLTRVGEFTPHSDCVKVLALNAAAKRCSKFA